MDPKLDRKLTAWWIGLMPVWWGLVFWGLLVHLLAFPARWLLNAKDKPMELNQRIRRAIYRRYGLMPDGSSMQRAAQGPAALESQVSEFEDAVRQMLEGARGGTVPDMVRLPNGQVARVLRFGPGGAMPTQAASAGGFPPGLFGAIFGSGDQRRKPPES
jgi:hypothetical protein